MWNPFRRLGESDKSRLRRLERTVDDLAADVTLTSERLVKLDARMRGRARRALAEADVGEAAEGQGDGLGLSREPLSPVQPEQLDGEDRSSTRERLRALARQKFGRAG